MLSLGVSRSMLGSPDLCWGLGSTSCLHSLQGWSCGQKPSVHTDVSNPADPGYRDAGAPHNMSLGCKPSCSFTFFWCSWVAVAGGKEARAVGGLLLHGIAARRAISHL